MSTYRTNFQWTGIALLAITAVGWGLNWPAIKFILSDWPPLFSRGLAGMIGAALLAGFALARGESLRVSPDILPRLAFASFTNVFAWMGFTTIAMKHLSVAECALLVYTMPIWVALLSWPLLGIRLDTRSVFALLLGFTGLLVLFGAQSIAFDSGKVIGISLSLSAAILFALGSILNRRALPLAPLALVAWQVALACVPMAAIGLLYERPDLAALKGPGWIAFAYMALVPMAVCYVTWFATLRHLSPPAAAIGTLAVPVIGVVTAAMMLGEPFGTREIFALVLTIAGVWFALAKPAPAGT
jgi:drug/metabolite transporter (DMT)-like permease